MMQICSKYIQVFSKTLLWSVSLSESEERLTAIESSAAIPIAYGISPLSTNAAQSCLGCDSWLDHSLRLTQ